MNNKDIERLCKRHMARLLSKLEAMPNGVDEEHKAVIMKSNSFLMDDLKASLSKEKQNGQNQIY